MGSVVPLKQVTTSLMLDWLIGWSYLLHYQELGFCERVPGMGILLVIATIVIYQGGNVVAKKMSTPPFLMILVRDVISLFLTAPLNIQQRAPPFQRGYLLLTLLRSLTMAALLCGYFYAVSSANLVPN